MKFIINEIPKTDNYYKGRQQYWEYRQDKSRWSEMVYHLCKENKIKPIDGKAVVTIRYHWTKNIRRVPETYTGGMILSGLRAAKIIKDDSFHWITLVLDAVYDEEEEYTEVEIIKSKREVNP